MVHLHHNCCTFSKDFHVQISQRWTGCCSQSWRIPYPDEANQVTGLNKNLHGPVVMAASADRQESLVSEKLRNDDEKLLPSDSGYLVSSENWPVRRMMERKETREVAAVQAEAFYEPMFLFNDVFFEFFKAEVLSGLVYRLRNSSPDSYACLVALAESRSELWAGVVGVVDVTVQREGSVLENLQGVEEYLYVSGMAVLKKFRRKGVATALLKACDALCSLWGFRYLVLRAYEDDYGAQKLYSMAGYRIVSRDPPWVLPWIGARRRVLMAKQMETP